MERIGPFRPMSGESNKVVVRILVVFQTDLHPKEVVVTSNPIGDTPISEETRDSRIVL